MHLAAPAMPPAKFVEPASGMDPKRLTPQLDRLSQEVGCCQRLVDEVTST